MLVDRATFPSDTISTHILWPHGAEVLARWKLLETLAATITGAIPLPDFMSNENLSRILAAAENVEFQA